MLQLIFSAMHFLIFEVCYELLLYEFSRKESSNDLAIIMYLKSSYFLNAF